MPFHYPEGKILLFAKAPRPGTVKTRLARTYGARGAARLYVRMLRETLDIVAGLAPLELWCAPDTSHPTLRGLARHAGARLRSQHGMGLGERMFHGFEHALERGPWSVIIGGDCVSLSRTDIDVACAFLRRGRDAVMVPAEDGGYVLLGLRRVEPELFHGIDWGGEHVAHATRRRLDRLGFDRAELPVRWDVDRPRDVRRWLRLRRGFGV